MKKFPISRERFRVCCRADVHAGPVPKPISFHLAVKWRPRINTVIWVWIAEQGASFPLGASWWAPKLEDEKVQQYNQQPQRAASHCHFDHVTVCVCARARDCSVKKPVAHRALHHLISLTHTHHPLKPTRLSAAFSSLFLGMNLSVVTTAPLCQHTHTHSCCHSCWPVWASFQSWNLQCDCVSLSQSFCYSQIHQKEDTRVDYGKYNFYICTEWLIQVSFNVYPASVHLCTSSAG